MTEDPSDTRTTSTTHPPHPSRGATTAEYLGVIVVVAAIIAALAATATPLGTKVTDGITSAVCSITGTQRCSEAATGTGTGGQADPVAAGPRADPGQPLTVTITDDTAQGCDGALDCTGSALAGFGRAEKAADLAVQAAAAGRKTDAEAATTDGGRPTAATDPAFTKGPLGKDFRPGVHDPEGMLTAEERAIADFLHEHEGAQVDPRLRDDSQQGIKQPDTMIRLSPQDPGSIVEFKTLKGSSVNAVERNLAAAAEQSADGVVAVDGRAVGLTREMADRAWTKTLSQPGRREVSKPNLAYVILGDGTLVVYRKAG